MDSDAELRLAILSSIAQEESRKTSERVKWGQKRQMERGVVFGRSMLGYDVKDGKMYINEEGAKIVRLIFHKFVNEKKGAHVIARELQEAGIQPMRCVKEWQNTVILRIIRNEKYCGDLVQKKTYTPDFLTHEKKINLGQEEFIIIKDHHEPIISREMFDEANHILDERSFSQTGKAKHSSRYPFSGKIKCGCCGSSYVARYKNRKNGNCYKAWRCNEAAKHGSPHIDKAGNTVGCTGLSIRNEDVIYIMSHVTRSLQYDKEKMKDDLISIILSVLSSDTQHAIESMTQGAAKNNADTDARKLAAKIQMLEMKRTNFIELYLSGHMTGDEWKEASAKCDHEIIKLRAAKDNRKQYFEKDSFEPVVLEDRNKLQNLNALEYLDQQRKEQLFKQDLVQKITEVINELIQGVEYEDIFYKELLDKMVVYDKNHMDLYLQGLPFKWSYTAVKT